MDGPNFDEMMSQGPMSAPTEAPTPSPTPQTTTQQTTVPSGPNFDEMMSAGPGQAGEAGAIGSQSTGWLSKDNLKNIADLGPAATNPALAFGRGAVQYYQGKNTVPAAVYHGATSMIAGDLPERLRDAGRNALSNYLGIGSPTPQDQTQKDLQFETQLQAQHPIGTWGGRILSLFGLGAAGAAGEGALMAAVGPVSKATSLGSKIAYSGLISAGAGALAGFGNGGSWDDRVRAAKTGAVVSGFLGLAGGALGGWLGGKQASAAAEAAKETAAEHIGLKMAAPVSQQLPEYGTAASNVVPSTEMSAADVAQNLKDKGVALLRQAGTKEAILSADGVRSIGADVMAMAEAQNIDIGRHFNMMSPKAQQAWQIVEGMAQRAENMPQNMKLTPVGSIPWKDVMNDALRMNNLYGPGDRDYNIIRTSFFKWIDNLANAEMFSGDRSGLADFANFRAMYRMGNLVNDKSALGKIFDYAHSPQQVVNWLNAATQLGEHAPAVGLVDSLKGLLGDAAPEWEALRSTAWNHISAANETTTGAKLAQRIDALRQSPFASHLFAPEQVQSMGKFADVLKTLPNKAAPAKNIIGHAIDVIKGHGAEGATPALAGLAGAGHAAWHGISSGHSPMEIAWDAIQEGALAAGGAFGAGKLTGIPPAAVQYSAPFAITKALLPPPRSQPAQVNKQTGGEVQHNASNKETEHSHSPSVGRALRIARRAKYDDGGDVDNSSEPTFSSQPPPQDNSPKPDFSNMMGDPTAADGGQGQSSSNTWGLPPRMSAMGHALAGGAKGLYDLIKIPGESTQQIEPTTPGMLSEEDVARQRMADNRFQNAAHKAALQMMGGARFAPPGSVGITGGVLRQSPQEEAALDVARLYRQAENKVKSGQLGEAFMPDKPELPSPPNKKTYRDTR